MLTDVLTVRKMWKSKKLLLSVCVNAFDIIHVFYTDIHGAGALKCAVELAMAWALHTLRQAEQEAAKQRATQRIGVK